MVAQNMMTGLISCVIETDEDRGLCSRYRSNSGTRNKSAKEEGKAREGKGGRRKPPLWRGHARGGRRVKGRLGGNLQGEGIFNLQLATLKVWLGYGLL